MSTCPCSTSQTGCSADEPAYGRADIELLLDNLRMIPDMHIRTTLIVGFPGESERDFDQLLDFVKTTRIDRLSAYAYSPEPGTPAERLSEQVPVTVKRDRVRRLMKAQASVSQAHLRQLVGRILEVLVDSPGVGRTEWDAPEVDGVVKLTGAKADPGRFVQALVIGSSTHDIRARVAGQCIDKHSRLARIGRG